ncbi:Lipoprotein LpqB [Streptomyces violaceorubidus]
MSWAGDARLVVVGRERGGVQQIGYVQVDGSTPEASVPAALTGVKEIAATEDERLPLVAYSEDLIVPACLSGLQWQKVTEGTAPVYPGVRGRAAARPGRVFHRPGRVPRALAQWWPCGDCGRCGHGGRTSRTWCCRPSAVAAAGLARCCAPGAVRR